MIKEKRLCKRCGIEKTFYNHTDICQACKWYERKHGIIKDAPLVIRDNLKKEHPDEYKIWRGMIRRCSGDPNRYKRYSGRGIKVCERWSGAYGFHNFYADMGHRPDGVLPCGLPKYSLDRIDSNRGYYPENCRWASLWEQASNTTKKRMYSDKVGVTYNKALGLWQATLYVNGERHTKYSKNEADAIRFRKQFEDEYLS